MKRLYHFLGSVYFTCTLLTTIALFVCVGTIIESKTDSHAYASIFTYRNPVFGFLLWMVFVNILVAALRRYPFKSKHIPFLITHFGLLMVVGGVLVKHYYGVQGTLLLYEGTESRTLTLPDTFRITVQDREKTTLPLPAEFKLLQKAPHVEESWETWFKGNLAIINGIAPFPVTSSPQKSHLKMPDSHEPLWDLYAFRTDDPWLQKRYFADTRIRFTDRQTGKVVAEQPLADTLTFDDGEAKVSFSPEALTLDIRYKEHSATLTLPLQGEKALLNYFPLAIDLIRKPALIFSQKSAPDVTLTAIDAHGQIYEEHFSKETIESYFTYDEGFGGTHIQAKIPIAPYPFGRKEREEAHLKAIGALLIDAVSPPLELFAKSCQIHDLDFASVFPDFLYEWAISTSFLYPQEKQLPSTLSTLMQTVPWELLPETDLKACYWAAYLLDDLDPGHDLLTQLRQREWPLIASLEGIVGADAALTALIQQLFLIAGQLPPAPKPKTPEQNAQLLSAFLRAYGIHLNALSPPLPQEELTLECPLTFHYTPKTPHKKLEENTPGVTLLYKNTPLTLGYKGPQIPTPDGKYLVSFGPEKRAIPHTLRLHDARQVCYPNTSQPFSYESDIRVDGEKATLSMNRVYETKDGYRIYLANITPAEETALQKVQLIVNYDPAKYWLTYPGGGIVSLGIVMLLWMRPYSARSRR